MITHHPIWKVLKSITVEIMTIMIFTTIKVEITVQVISNQVKRLLKSLKIILIVQPLVLISKNQVEL